MMVVAVHTGNGLRVDRAQELFEGNFFKPSRTTPDVHSYDVSKDGERFLMIRPDQNDLNNPDLRVIIGWADS